MTFWDRLNQIGEQCSGIGEGKKTSKCMARMELKCRPNTHTKPKVSPQKTFAAAIPVSKEVTL